VKELPNFMRKYYLIAELLIFKLPMTKYLGFQYCNTACCSHLSGSDGVLTQST